MGAGAGLEPTATADEAAMLPLHHPAKEEGQSPSTSLNDSDRSNVAKTIVAKRNDRTNLKIIGIQIRRKPFGKATNTENMSIRAFRLLRKIEIIAINVLASLFAHI